MLLKKTKKNLRPCGVFLSVRESESAIKLINAVLKSPYGIEGLQKDLAGLLICLNRRLRKSLTQKKV